MLARASGAAKNARLPTQQLSLSKVTRTPSPSPQESFTMLWFGATPLKKFPAPILRPMAPFIAAALVIGYGVNSIQNSMMNSDEFKNDPRNPNAKAGSH
ncbi:hypothetical protein N656DRAFT_794282 [Canariomyces notabilis]|uniref:Uncharacterized protein n=1 Tax=Canariomyces notabilis TaxID=2074819 RepID=A0AAN6YXL5_9PEZI|nr:hypothetical protein N656DRAFT_794282 [Canariomyces arenarius]